MNGGIVKAQKINYGTAQTDEINGNGGVLPTATAEYQLGLRTGGSKQGS